MKKKAVINLKSKFNPGQGLECVIFHAKSPMGRERERERERESKSIE